MRAATRFLTLLLCLLAAGAACVACAAPASAPTAAPPATATAAPSDLPTITPPPTATKPPATDTPVPVDTVAPATLTPKPATPEPQETVAPTAETPATLTDEQRIAEVLKMVAPSDLALVKAAGIEVEKRSLSGEYATLSATVPAIIVNPYTWMEYTDPQTGEVFTLRCTEAAVLNDGRFQIFPFVHYGSVDGQWDGNESINAGYQGKTYPLSELLAMLKPGQPVAFVVRLEDLNDSLKQYTERVLTERPELAAQLQVRMKIWEALMRHSEFPDQAAPLYIGVMEEVKSPRVE